MPTIFEQIIDLKTKAKNRRDMGRYGRARAFLEQAIALAEEDLTVLELRSKVASELADCYGIVGGIERRWALVPNAPEEHRADHIRKSVRAYDAAYLFESGDYGIVSSYGLVNRLVSRILADREALASGHVTDLGEGIEALEVPAELEKARVTIENSKRSDYWAAADLALVKLLLGADDPASTYAAFTEKSPPDYAYKSVLDVLRPLREESLPVKNALADAVTLVASSARIEDAIPMANEPTNPTMERLEDQIRWYDGKSASSKHWYKWLKSLTLFSGVLVPVVSTVVWGRPYAAVLGIIIVISEGLQQINQYQANWISYRSTCETLKHEKYLYLARAGPYASADNPLSLLAERIEGLVSQEHAKWVSSQERSKKLSPSPRT